MAIKKVKLPNNMVVDINDPRIPGVDTTPTSGSSNVVSSGGTYSEVHPAIVTTQPSGGFVPNKLYVLGTLTGTITFTLATPTDSNIANEYHWTFTAGSPAPTITWPAGLTWVGGEPPTITAGKKYEISVLQNIAGNVTDTTTGGGGGSGGGGDYNIIETVKVNGAALVPDEYKAVDITVPTVPTISTSVTSDASSDDKTSSPKSVKTYVDSVVGDIETLLAALL